MDLEIPGIHGTICYAQDSCALDPSCSNYHNCRTIEVEPAENVIPMGEPFAGFATSMFQFVTPLMSEPPNPNLGEIFLSIPEAQIPGLVDEYVKMIQTEETTKVCKCEWDVHPDDVNIPALRCRICQEAPTHENHFDPNETWPPVDITDEDLQHVFKGRRVRRKDDHPECPVHTKAGYILGFFRWVFRDVPKAD